jgi:aquaporin Z
MLTVMIYMGGPISGAHYNPAVTLAAILRGKITLNGAMQYWLFQILGAFTAAFILWVTYGTPVPLPSPAPGFQYNLKPVLLEVIFTFALVSVILNVAMSKKSAGNSYFGLAIGFTVLASAFAVGPISGGAFNPAVALGPMLMDIFVGGVSFINVWIYVVGPFLGALLAAFVYKLMNPDEE